jgi:transcription elongation factor Elf1
MNRNFKNKFIMKKFTTILFVLLSVVMFSCSNNDDNESDEPPKGSGTERIEIQAYTDVYDAEVSFSATAKTMAIDWGGVKQEFTPNGEKTIFSFIYNTSKLQTITAIPEKLTGWSNTADTVNNYRSISNFKSIIFDNCYELKVLDMSNSSTLTNLDVSGCCSLVSLICSYNQLTELDLSKNTELTTLLCNSNSLTSLDISKNTKLTTLVCSYNSNLASLDISENKLLKMIDCRNNKFDATALSHLLNSLPRRQKSDSASIYISGNPGLAHIIIIDKTSNGWSIID